jgi:hypothetical protein
MLLYRIAAGAVIGAIVSLGALTEAGAIWGAVVRAAPCYGGGEPPRLGGALFGAMALPALLGPYVAPAAALLGAAFGGLLPQLAAFARMRVAPGLRRNSPA